MRKCKYKECGTILNSYNQNPCCAIHQMKWIAALERKIKTYELDIAKRKSYIVEAKHLKTHRREILIARERIARLKKRINVKYPIPEMGREFSWSK